MYFWWCLARRQPGEVTASDPFVPLQQTICPMGPMCVKLCYSQCENVHLSTFQRTGGKGDVTALLPCQGTTNVSNPTFTFSA